MKRIGKVFIGKSIWQNRMRENLFRFLILSPLIGNPEIEPEQTNTIKISRLKGKLNIVETHQKKMTNISIAQRKEG